MEKISCLTIHLCRQVTNFIAFWFTLLVCVYFEKVNRCIYFLLLSYRKGHTLNFCPWLLAIQKYILEIVPFQCIDIFIFFPAVQYSAVCVFTQSISSGQTKHQCFAITSIASMNKLTHLCIHINLLPEVNFQSIFFG